MAAGYYGFIVLGIALSLVGMYISSRLKSKFRHYGQIGVSSGMTGREVALTMLKHYNIHDVSVVEGQGFLTDHYNPITKTVTLSPPVFRSNSVAAAAVAAHECGHAVQHDTAYSMLQLRSKMVPVVKVAASAQQWLLLAAFLLYATMPQLLLVTIIAFTVTTAFSFITLPVEFDASKRALVWLNKSGVTRSGQEFEGAKDALNWAALTYVSAALSSLVMLLYLVMTYMGRD